MKSSLQINYNFLPQSQKMVPRVLFGCLQLGRGLRAGGGMHGGGPEQGGRDLFFSFHGCLGF